jgi:RNA polymerase sigma-32 factor
MTKQKTKKNQAPKKPKKPDSHLPIAVSPQQLPVLSPKDRDILQLYIREINRFQLLSPDEEKELTRRYNESQDPEIFKRLVQANLRFVVKIAFEYSQYGAKLMDTIQEGNMGLMKAIRDFNPYKEVRLTTYAVWWIRSYIQDFLLRNWSLVRIGTTASQKKLFYRLKKEQQRLEQMGINPQIQQIAHNLGVEERDVAMMQERLSGGDVSIDAPIRSQSNEASESVIESRFADLAELASDTLEKKEQSALFKKALDEFVNELDERELVIFRERLLAEQPRTLVEIGADYNVSKERARQIEEKIKTKLRVFLAEKYPDISID